MPRATTPVQRLALLCLLTPLAVTAGFLTTADAQTRKSSALVAALPQESVFVIEAENGRELVRGTRATGLIDRALQSPAYRSFLASGDGKELSQGIGMLERHTGLNLGDLLEAALDGPIAFALVSNSKAAEPQPLLIAKPNQRPVLQKLLNLATLLAGDEVRRRTHLGLPVLSIGKLHFIWLGDTLLVGTKRTWLEGAVLRLRGDSSSGGFQSKSYSQGQSLLHAQSQARAFLNLAAARQLPHNPLRALLEPMEEPLVSLLAGGYARAIGSADGAAIGFRISSRGIEAEVITLAGSLPSEFSYFFPKQVAEAASLGKDMVASLQLVRSLGSWWESREALIAESGLEDMTEFAAEIANFFGGLDFDEDFLRLLGSPAQLIVTPPTSRKPAPSPLLPGFALIVPTEKDSSFHERLRVAFQTIVSVVNVERMQSKQRPLLLQGEIHRGISIASAATLSGAEAGPIGIEGNFSPALAQVGQQLIIASHIDAAKQAVDALKDAGKPTAPKGDRLRVDAALVQDLIERNRESIIAGGVVEGKSRAEAVADYQILLEIVSWFDALEVRSELENGRLRLRGSLGIKPSSPSKTEEPRDSKERF